MNTCCRGGTCNSLRKKDVEEFYREAAKIGSKSIVLSNACRLPDTRGTSKYMSKVPKEILNSSFGCGSCVPYGIEGKSIVDLGCGAGRDCYIASAEVGKHGDVKGVDMTDELLEIANKHIDSFADSLGWRPNLTFLKGDLENLLDCGIAKSSVHICTSNCVVNLLPNKWKLLTAVYDILCDGGEFYFCDIFCDRQLGEDARSDKQLVGECLGGALYYRDFISMTKKIGFTDSRILNFVPISYDEEACKHLLRGANFFSATFRLFKLNELQTYRENHGDTVEYLGTIDEQSTEYKFDIDTKLPSHTPTTVDRNAAISLAKSWLQKHFVVKLNDGTDISHMGPSKSDEASITELVLKCSFNNCG